MSEVVVVGSLAADRVVVAGVVGAERAGGVVNYAGLTYRRHSLVTGAVFHADLDRHPGLVDGLLRAGVRPHLGTAFGVTRFENRVDGDGRAQRLLEVADPIEPALVLEAVTTATRLVHLGPLHPADIREGVATAVGHLELVVALDVQGLTRGPGRDGEVLAEVAAEIEPFLRAASIVKADASELGLLLTHLNGDVTALLEEYAIDELVETHGSLGGVVHLPRGDQIEYQPPAPESGDPTGAGDVFFAAYLVGRVFRGADATAASGYAAAVAAEQVGGRYLRL